MPIIPVCPTINIMSNQLKKCFFAGFFLIIAGVSLFLGCASGTSAGGGKEVIIYQEDFENYSGGSLYVTNRGKTWHGAIRALTILKPGQTYRISVWAMYDDDSAPSQAVNISIQQNVDGQGETYSNIGATLRADIKPMKTPCPAICSTFI